MPGLNAAFVNIGHEKDAFIHYLDLGSQFSSLQKAGGELPARQAGNPPGRDEAGAADRKVGQDRLLPAGGADRYGAGGQRGDFHQGTAPDGRYFAGRTQRGAGAFFRRRCSCRRRSARRRRRSGSRALQPPFCRRISALSSARRLSRPRTAISNRISAPCWTNGRRPCKIFARIPPGSVDERDEPGQHHYPGFVGRRLFRRSSWTTKRCTMRFKTTSVRSNRRARNS